MPSFQPANYPNHSIQIPPEFPKILKQYTKAAIRTQPYDLLRWSASYFRCLANGEVPPVKERLEFPSTGTKLTPGLLRVLHKQLGAMDTVNKSVLKAKWAGICLPQTDLEDILNQAQLLDYNIPWLKFLVEGALHTQDAPSTLLTMQILCEVMSDQSEVASFNLPTDKFIRAFRTVAERREMSPESVEEVVAFLERTGQAQGGKLNFQNFKAPACPNVD